MRRARPAGRATAYAEVHRGSGGSSVEKRVTSITVYLKQFTEAPNVGDAIGARIVEGVTGRRVQIAGEAPLPVPNLIGIGSILHWSDERSVIWGSGLIAPNLGYRIPAEVLAVRGTLTRDDLAARGVRCPDVLGDVGLLLPEFIQPSPPRHPVGLVPHYVDLDSAFVERCRRDGVPIVDVRETPETYVDQLTSCRRIVSSSLHGIVIAHAYGIAAAWVKISDRVHGDGFKFFDYYSSLGVAARDVQMLSPEAHTIEQMAEACWSPGTLPDRRALRAVLERKIAELDLLVEV
jgi:pyruvyltransferase